MGVLPINAYELVFQDSWCRYIFTCEYLSDTYFYVSKIDEILYFMTVNSAQLYLDMLSYHSTFSINGHFQTHDTPQSLILQLAQHYDYIQGAHPMGDGLSVIPEFTATTSSASLCPTAFKSSATWLKCTAEHNQLLPVHVWGACIAVAIGSNVKHFKRHCRINDSQTQWQKKKNYISSRTDAENVSTEQRLY